MVHKSFFFFLAFIIVTAAIAVGVVGMQYYLTAVPLRPFRSDYALMRPSGTYSHGLGILGSCMILLGVTLYSTRKRLRRLRNVGRLSAWLHFHIFLCLLGPVLVVYHTTFKAGGIAAISLWTMLSVVASGIIGRFLYVQIPRNLKGHELTDAEIQNELDRLSAEISGSAVGARLVEMIDQRLSSIRHPNKIVEVVSTFVRLQNIKRHLKHSIREILFTIPVPPLATHRLYRAASDRAVLIQRTIVLHQVERLFYYWHVIHLPFTLIMFITLAAHVAVALLMGYTWIL